MKKYVTKNLIATVGDSKANNLDHKRKRSDFDSTNDVSLSYNKGIEHFNGKQPTEAKHFFLMALNQQRAEATSQTTFDSLEFLEKEIMQALTTSKADCQSRKRMHFLSRDGHEYDEGMDIFTDVFDNNQAPILEMQYATLFYNIGQACRCSKEYEEAKKWFMLTLAIVEVFENDPEKVAFLDVVKVQHNLGSCSYRLGENREAIRYYQASLENAHKLGTGELNLAATYNCLGVLYLQSTLSDSKKAIEFFRLSLSIYRKQPGGHTKEVGTVLNNIGRVLYVQSEFDEALKVYLEALEIRREVLGRGSIDVAATVINIGQTQHKRGNLDDAMACYKEFLEIISPQFGTNNGDIATAYKCMAKVFIDRGDIGTARSMYEKALQSERAAYGKCHPQLASTLNTAGTLCFELNDNHAALEYFEEGLKLEFENIESNRPNIITTLRNIAQIHKDNGDYAKAISVHKEAYIHQVEVHGKSSLESASTLNSLGLMHFLLNEFWFSLVYYQGALEAQRSCLGSDNHKEIASTLNCVGLCFYKLMKYDLARDSFIECIRIRQSIGLVQRDLADSCYNLGTVFTEIGDDDQAIFYYDKALRIEQKDLGEDHSELRATLQQLGQSHQNRGDYDEAIKYFSRVLSIERKAGGENSVFKLLNIIGNLHLMSGNVDQMMECYIEALRVRKSCEETEQDIPSLVVTGHNFYAHSKLNPKCAALA